MATDGDPERDEDTEASQPTAGQPVDDEDVETEHSSIGDDDVETEDSRAEDDEHPESEQPESGPSEPSVPAIDRMEAVAARTWGPFIAIGLAIVLLSFVVGIRVSYMAGDYYGADKVTREAYERDSDPAKQKAWIESTKVWLPTLKFLGMGMILGGVSLLLATVLGALRTGGRWAQEGLGSEFKPMETPTTAYLVPAFMALGMIILIAGLIIGIVIANLSFDYWNHSIVNNLDPSTTGLLRDLGIINAVTLWLQPFSFVGVALMLTSIGMALATMVKVLRQRTERISDIVSQRTERISESIPGSE